MDIRWILTIKIDAKNGWLMLFWNEIQCKRLRNGIVKAFSNLIVWTFKHTERFRTLIIQKYSMIFHSIHRNGILFILIIIWCCIRGEFSASMGTVHDIDALLNAIVNAIPMEGASSFLICLIIQIKWCWVVVHKFRVDINNGLMYKSNFQYQVPSTVHRISIHCFCMSLSNTNTHGRLKRMNSKIQPWMDDLLCSIQCVLKTRNAYDWFFFFFFFFSCIHCIQLFHLHHGLGKLNSIDCIQFISSIFFFDSCQQVLEIIGCYIDHFEQNKTTRAREERKKRVVEKGLLEVNACSTCHRLLFIEMIYFNTNNSWERYEWREKQTVRFDPLSLKVFIMINIVLVHPIEIKSYCQLTRSSFDWDLFFFNFNQ